MVKQIKSTIQAKGVEIALLSAPDQADYISLTDIAKYRSDYPDDVVKNWLRSRDTIPIWRKQLLDFLIAPLYHLKLGVI